MFHILIKFSARNSIARFRQAYIVKMWKVIILSALLCAVEGATVKDIYGNHSFVLVYPNNIITEPACGGITFSEDPRNIACTCSDERDCTLVVVRLLDRKDPTHPPFVKIRPVSLSVPVLVVDDLGNLPLANVSCNYASTTFSDRSIIEIVNKNYMLGYVTTNTNDTIVFLMARELPTTLQLEEDITNIDKLKNKDWTRLCTREIYDRLHGPLLDIDPS